MVATGPEVATLTLHDADGLYEDAPKLGFPGRPPVPRAADALSFSPGLNAVKTAMAGNRHRGKAGRQGRYYEKVAARIARRPPCPIDAAPP